MTETRTVLIYSSHEEVRRAVKLAIGTQPLENGPTITYLEATENNELMALADTHVADLMILDAESAPAGGMGMTRELRMEVTPCPPLVLLIARTDDRWLAAWSEPDLVLQYPLHPTDAAAAVAKLLP